MKAMVVLNGEYYAGENAKDNKLIFIPDRSKAVVVDERRLRFIVRSIIGWFMSGEKNLKRLEILEAKEDTHAVQMPKV